MKAVNLLPRERGGNQLAAKRGGLREPLLILSIVAVVLVVTGVGYEAHSAGSTVAARNAAISSLDAQIAALPKPETQPAATGSTSRTAAVTKLVDERTSWDGFLSSISRVVPEDVWMLSLSAQPSAPVAGATTSAAPAPAPATPGAAPSGFTVTGYTYSQPSVARLMRRLALVPWLQDVSLVTTTKSALANRTVYQFTIGANFVALPEVGT
jgi:Tfp pilus assembly protein PilN